MTTAHVGHGLDKSVVSRWKARIPAGELQRVATKKGEQLDDAVFDCAKGNLESLTAQAKAVSDPEWIRKQSAKDLAMLHGVMFDKSFRILERVESPGSNHNVSDKGKSPWA